MYLVINKWVITFKVSNFSGQYLRNYWTLDIGVLGYIGIVWPKEHSPEVWSVPPVTPCIWTWKQQGWEVDQEMDGKIKWGRMEGWLVEKGGRKRYITERNGRSSWEQQGIVTFCTCQWNELMWVSIKISIIECCNLSEEHTEDGDRRFLPSIGTHYQTTWWRHISDYS